MFANIFLIFWLFNKFFLFFDSFSFGFGIWISDTITLNNSIAGKINVSLPLAVIEINHV